MKKIETDIAIFGGGIAGLWLLNKLRQQGFSTILLETGTLGGGQTHKSQGIIHGGLKYALQGKITQATKAIADMPAFWQHCLTGQGDIDLTTVPILAAQQYLWSTQSFTSKMAGFLANLSLKSGTRALSKKDFPRIFQHPGFKGQVYGLDEIVIDVPALIMALAKPHIESIYHINTMTPEDIQLDANKRIRFLQIQTPTLPPLEIVAKKYIFTAGCGNDLILNKLNMPTLAMQRRPLHMVWVKHHMVDPLFGHCLGLNSVPRLTITTHRTQENEYVWYLGGQLAEEGVNRNETSQIKTARDELKTLFPWLDFSNAIFSSFRIDRAENKEKSGTRPSQCFFQHIENSCIAWPIKLAFAPLLAHFITHSLPTTLQPDVGCLTALQNWPHPIFALPMWKTINVNST